MNLLGKPFRGIFNELIYSGHIMSLGGAAAAYTACLLLNLNISLYAIITIYLFVQPIYWIDRRAGVVGDAEGNKERSIYIQHVSRWFIPIMCILYILLFGYITLATSKYISFVFGILLFILGSLYELWFKQITRYFLAFKDYFVGFFFALFIIYIYIYAETSILRISTYTFLFYIFLRTVLIQVFFDMKDVEDDRNHRLKTYPTILGKKNVLNGLMISNFLSFIPIFVGYIYGLFPWISIALICTHLIYHIIIVQEKYKSFYYHYVLMGSEYIIAAIILSFMQLL